MLDKRQKILKELNSEYLKRECELDYNKKLLYKEFFSNKLVPIQEILIKLSKRENSDFLFEVEYAETIELKILNTQLITKIYFTEIGTDNKFSITEKVKINRNKLLQLVYF